MSPVGRSGRGFRGGGAPASRAGRVHLEARGGGEAMKTLVLVGARASGATRRDHEEGTVRVAITEEAAEALRAADVPHRSLASLLDVDQRDRIDEAAIDWTKAWG